MRLHFESCQYQRLVATVYIVQIVSQDSRCKKLQLQELLIAPLHRITRIPLLLKETRKQTVDLVERHKLDDIIDTMEESLRMQHPFHSDD